MRIVLVDQESEYLVGLEEVLKKSNPKANILMFNDSYKALEYIGFHSVDEVYVEISMYGMTGFALTKRIKEISKHIKVILMASSEEYAIEAWKVHADYFLIKPVRLEAILQMRE